MLIGHRTDAPASLLRSKKSARRIVKSAKQAMVCEIWLTKSKSCTNP